MPTKYILHGGRMNRPYTKEFLEEMILDKKGPISILIVPFAKEKEKWQPSLESNKKAFGDAFPQKKFSFLLANENPEKFLDQVHTADILFIGGGNDLLLQSFFKQIPLTILQQHFANKTITGTSAGANLLAKYYYSNDRQQIEEGLGILPIKTFCHYTEEKEFKLQELEAYKESLTSFALPEDYFVVIQ